MEGGLLVRRIGEGTVIDHIPAGRALVVLRLLGLERPGSRVAVVMNAESSKLGRKDIVKVEGLLLGGRETDVVSLVAPTATINIVKGGRVVSKKKVRPPGLVEGIIRCPNPNCITSKPGEPSTPRFSLVKASPLTYRCLYCSTTVEEHEIPGLISPGLRP